MCKNVFKLVMFRNDKIWSDLSRMILCFFSNYIIITFEINIIFSNTGYFETHCQHSFY